MPEEFKPQEPDPKDRYAIVVAQWNQLVTDKLLDGAVETLLAAGVADHAIHVAQVPGSWELPLAAQQLARSGEYAAVICLGVVIQGETTHDQHINRGVSLALSQISLECELPLPLGLLTVHSLEQALARAGGDVGNKGSECAEAALHMVGLLRAMPEG